MIIMEMIGNKFSFLVNKLFGKFKIENTLTRIPVNTIGILRSNIFLRLP